MCGRLRHSNDGSSMIMRDQQRSILCCRFPRRQVSTRIFVDIMPPIARSIENAHFARTTKIHRRTLAAPRKCLHVVPWFRKYRTTTFFATNGGQVDNVPCDDFRFLPLDIFRDETFPSGVKCDARSVGPDACRPPQNETVSFHANKECHVMSKRTRRPTTTTHAQPPSPSAAIARTAKTTLRSYAVGSLPILNGMLQRMRLEEYLRAALPPEDRRTKLSPVKALMVLLRNLLLSRAPIYGMGEWAARHAPDLLGLTAEEIERLNDDGVGRALDRLFLADVPSLVLAVATQVVKEFGVRLDELHNDSTTISFCGAYASAAVEQRFLGRPTLAITFGHNKDHRPDLKQLLFILTVTADGGVPLHFRAANGNVTDDQTHRDTWELLCQLTGRRDFLYVADCKLATSENMAYLHQRQGRFVTVLPRTRAEDGIFRELVAQGQVSWRPIWEKTNDDGDVIDRFSISDQPAVTAEGYRLVWYHSLRKAEADAVVRSNRIELALKRLAALRDKLRSPRTRYRNEAKVAEAVAEILQSCGAASWIVTEIQPRTQETFHQNRRGRPGKETQYVKSVTTRFDLAYRIDDARVAVDAAGDGIFPLVTNVVDFSELELLKAYKRQPTIEKRFSQLKTDFEVAPVYLKAVHRIQALLCVYFFALLVESLLERQLRQAMQRQSIDALPMYPEGRACRWPTARRVIDLFEPMQRHMLAHGTRPAEALVTELTRLQRKLLKLLGLSAKDYGR
jgi:transposase